MPHEGLQEETDSKVEVKEAPGVKTVTLTVGGVEPVELVWQEIREQEKDNE